MCGIVGYVGRANKAQEVILSGLERLEYRGYDSSGIAVLTNSKLECHKFKGKLSVLKDFLSNNTLNGNVGIGHTRWATHGNPTNENAHPHINEKNNIAIVHNGIIENYLELKQMLIENGYVFKSETDSEVIVYLFDMYYDENLLNTAFKVRELIRGTYAIVIIHNDQKEEFIAIRNEAPLVIGYGEKENFVASDITAILEYTKDISFLDNGEIAVVKKDSVVVYDKNKNMVQKEHTTINWSLEQATKCGYKHFMLKEIHEQPSAIRDTLNSRIDKSGLIKLDDIKLTESDIKKFNKIYIVACGTAFHAGCVGKYVIEKLSKIPVTCEIASEFRYQDPFVDENTLTIIVSQSGETADTLSALRLAKRKGSRILSITNVVDSSIARESDDVFYTWAGPEIAVASTKAYTTQLTAFYMIALNLGLYNKTLSINDYKQYIKLLMQTADVLQNMLENTDEEKQIANEIKDSTSIFYLGRLVDGQTAKEMALKLKEISYIFAESFVAGELKHGPIALIEKGTPVIALSTQKNMVEKMISNIQEVKARGAYVIGIGNEHDKALQDICQKFIKIPNIDDLFMPLVSVLPGQLIAYYVSDLKGYDVDKPRNLAKSVTVE